MYRINTAFVLILLASELLKILRAKADAYFLKKLVFVTNKCLAQMPLKNVKGQQKTIQNYVKHFLAPNKLTIHFANLLVNEPLKFHV